MKRERGMKNVVWMAFLLLPALGTYLIIHEGAHITTAVLQGEEVRGVIFYYGGVKVLLSTPEGARQGIKWGFIAISGIAFTLGIGYVLYFTRSKWLSTGNVYLTYFFFFLLVILLCGDPFYYCLYPVLGTGDIVGVSSFLNVPIVLVYLIALSLLAINLYLARIRVAREVRRLRDTVPNSVE